MPAPLGQPARDKKFLLRMTYEEDAFVRARARAAGTSLNDVIAALIRDAMPQPETKRGRRTKADLAADRTPGPGQISVTDE
ncbi:hypothetical protein ACFW34_35080 [Streptomyces sp. NPDC058848]|uniref:hypothetical protein n=1 Tax=Streptomyces sp. NPDC058848 TaxID=3346650 RepID=UPI00368A7185